MLIRKYIINCMVFLLLACSLQEATAEINDAVYGRRTAGSYGWQYGYSLDFDGNRLLVQVAIHFVAAPGVSRVQLEKVRSAWKKEIERVWSNQFVLATPDDIYPIVVEVLFNGRMLRHDVIVLPGGGRRSDELTWHIMDIPQTAAHEFGHMLGLYDEYAGGARDPQNKVYDPGSIMTSMPVTGKSRVRHYEQFKTWFSEKTGRQDVTLQALGE